MTESAIWAIFLLPLASFGVIALIVRPFLNRHYALSGLVLILPLTAAFALSIWTLPGSNSWRGPEPSTLTSGWRWGPPPSRWDFWWDQLTAIMLIVVTGVSLMVQIYSLGYMREDPGHARYFAYMALFTSAMLGLVLAINIIQLYVFWELVGVSSYLLIGFWHERPVAAAAAKKAFIITRIGDVGFLIAILYLFLQADQFAGMDPSLNAFHIPDIWQGGPNRWRWVGAILGGTALTWFALGIFAGGRRKVGAVPTP